MKLKTKFQDEDFELGEVVDATISTTSLVDTHIKLKAKAKRGGEHMFNFSRISELFELFEDYEEPEDFYIVEQRGTIGSRFRTGAEYEEKFKSIGNYFETREEAEKAVEKLKAWKRLKDKGFSFDPVDRYEALCGNGFNIPITATMPTEAYTDAEVSKDLDICFGGEE